uniref:Potassium/proton antiporter CemA n=1 Tax=Nephroselmis pyriformis TaxID=156128 RepID=A0A8A2H8G8_9CHLO|nr:chloroplast envelope membrane protein [Nephroselmis pyriformis]QSV37257.1 chloroplast envelope membrane protein [Nephroselmis pyriformis]
MNQFFAWSWWGNTPERALEIAYESANRMQTIRADYLRAYGEPRPNPKALNSAEAYLQAQLTRYAWTTRIRLAEFRLSTTLLAGQQIAEGGDVWERLQLIDRYLLDLESWQKDLFDREPVSPQVESPEVFRGREGRRTPTLAFEKTGLVPRSITRTFDRFRRELSPTTETLVIQEFRISRYQMLASFRYLASLVLIPWLVSVPLKFLVLSPLMSHWWNESHSEIFLNTYQQDRAFREMQAFQEKLYFEMLTGEMSPLEAPELSVQLNRKAVALAEAYNEDSIQSMTNLLGDLVAGLTLIILLTTGTAQIAVLKSFLDELLYSLSDATKAFLIILCTDVFVGFHSPHGWEVLLELVLRHLGLPESPNFIFLFVATFPVVLDTVLKYWIFRYLNQISPSAVATYHNMNE